MKEAGYLGRAVRAKEVDVDVIPNRAQSTAMRQDVFSPVVTFLTAVDTVLIQIMQVKNLDQTARRILR